MKHFPISDKILFLLIPIEILEIDFESNVGFSLKWVRNENENIGEISKYRNTCKTLDCIKKMPQCQYFDAVKM